MTHTGLRGALKDAHLLCPCGDLRVLVPCRPPAYRSPKQRVKEQLLCLAQKEVKAVFVAPKFCCLLLGWSSLAAGMAHKPDQDLIQPVAWAWSLQLVLQPFPRRQWHIHHRSSATISSWPAVVEFLSSQEPHLGCFSLLERAFVISGVVKKEQLQRSPVPCPAVCPADPGREPAPPRASADERCTVSPGSAMWVEVSLCPSSSWFNILALPPVCT